MVSLSLGEAAERARTSKVDIWRAIREGRLSAQRTDDGGFAIDAAEPFRVFEAQGRSEQPAMERDAATATEPLGQTETSMIPETAEANDIAVAFATLGAELKGILGLPVDERANTEPVSTMLKDKGPTYRTQCSTCCRTGCDASDGRKGDSGTSLAGGTAGDCRGAAAVVALSRGLSGIKLAVPAARGSCR